MINYNLIVECISLLILIAALSRLFFSHKKIVYKLLELAAYRDIDLNHITRLEQQIKKVHACNGCNQKRRMEKKK